MDTKNITGVMVQYYVTCERELWFYINQINMNYNNDDISIGKMIHEKSYLRDKKEIRIDNMVFDFAKNKNGLTIFEMKKSSRLTNGAKYQLYFYLYNLRLMEPNVRGILVYPKERKREELTLDENIVKEMEGILNGIVEVSNLNKPPSVNLKPYCKRCSFYELCMV